MSGNFVGYLLVISVSGCSACFLFRFPFSTIFFRSSLPVWMFSICSLCKFMLRKLLSLSYPHSLPPFFLFFCLSFDCQMKEVVLSYEKDKQDIALLRYSIILIISRQGLSFPEWRNIHRHLSAVLPCAINSSVKGHHHVTNNIGFFQLSFTSAVHSILTLCQHTYYSAVLTLCQYKD